MDQLDRIPKLIASYLRGDISAGDQQDLKAWINESEENRLFFMRVTDEKLLREKLKKFYTIDTNKQLNKTLKAIDPERKVISMGRPGRFKKFMVAASIVLIA